MARPKTTLRKSCCPLCEYESLTHRQLRSSVLCALMDGPGAAMAAVWTWREDCLAVMENGVRGTFREARSA
ncbi:hypothetical protein F4779DRAFT_588979 [Xylariaceae sp. FL0662B]|nr:hypothetical protein F4779DRAFT_588979 [Xylariaceae sp. FL0662B]